MDESDLENIKEDIIIESVSECFVDQFGEVLKGVSLNRIYRIYSIFC